MMDFLKRHRLKSTFKEYDFEIKNFQLDGIGQVDYAQWLHPFDKPKTITKAMVDFYQQFLKKGSMAIDIGAHTGDTTVPIALATGGSGLVLAFEPNQYVYKILEKNVTLNPDITHIVPYCLAATTEDGEFYFNYSDASFCNGGFLSRIKKKQHGHHYRLKIQGINLQNFLLENYKEDLKRLELIKIDAEGYDREILQSIPDILTTYKPNLLVECYKRLNKEERYSLFDLIIGHGYELFYLDSFENSGVVKKIEKKDMTLIQHFDMLAQPRRT
jgi:FkbM family methyltransferase